MITNYRHTYSADRIILLLLDVAVIAYAFVLSNLFRQHNYHLDYQYMAFFGLFTLIWCAVSGFNNFIFRIDGLINCSRRTGNLLNAFVLHALLLASTIVIFNLSALPPVLMLSAYLSTALLVGFSRLLVLQVLHSLTKTDAEASRFVIIGTGANAQALLHTFSTHANPDARFMGFFDDMSDDDTSRKQLLGPVRQLKAYCLQHNITQVYDARPFESQEQVHELAKFCNKHAVYFRLVPGANDVLPQSMERYIYRNVPVSGARTEPLELLLNKAMKRLLNTVTQSV